MSLEFNVMVSLIGLVMLRNCEDGVNVDVMLDIIFILCFLLSNFWLLNRFIHT